MFTEIVLKTSGSTEMVKYLNFGHHYMDSIGGVQEMKPTFTWFFRVFRHSLSQEVEMLKTVVITL